MRLVIALRLAAVVGLHHRLLLRRGLRLSRVRALDDLVELAAVEPHAAARRAIIDLDPLALGHGERGLVGGTKHIRQILWGRRVKRWMSSLTRSLRRLSRIS